MSNDNIKPMTHLEAFNKMNKGILQQGGQAYCKIRVGCRYRTEDDKRCAIGHILKGRISEANPVWESRCVVDRLTGTLTKTSTEVSKALQGLTLSFLERCQRVHDSGANMADVVWLAAWKEAAIDLKADAITLDSQATGGVHVVSSHSLAQP